mgnify:CR=1 FL=1
MGSEPTTSEIRVATAPEIDEKRIDSIYAELKDMQVVLDPNPIEFGPRRFNNRIAQVRALLNRVEQVFLQVSEDWHYFKRAINVKRNIFELERRELLARDPKTRVGRSQSERETLADVQLRTQIEEIQTLELALCDLETVMKVIKSKRTDLKDAQSRMRDQMKMIEQDLSMGARWGNRQAGPLRQPDPHNELGAASLDVGDMLDNLDKGMGWSEENSEVSTDVPVSDNGGELFLGETSTEEFEETETGEPESSGEDPVLEFPGLNESLISDDPLLLVEETPSKEITGEDSEVDDFLASLDAVTSEKPSMGSATLRELSSDNVDDLIASLAGD